MKLEYQTILKTMLAPGSAFSTADHLMALGKALLDNCSWTFAAGDEQAAV